MASLTQPRAEFDAVFPSLVNAAERAIRSFYRYDGSQVDDAIAETIARTYADWARVRRDDNPVAAVVARAKDVCIERIRRDAERATAVPADGVNAEVALSDVATISASMSWSLERLSRRQRDVAVLHYLMCCDDVTTAAALKTNVANVQAAAREARSRSLFVTDAALS